jgi:hypothetical protein
MKQKFVKIGELLLDVCMFVVSTILWTVWIGLICAAIAVIWVSLPILAIYCAITTHTTLFDSIVDEFDILIDILKEVFQSKDESD